MDAPDLQIPRIEGSFDPSLPIEQGRTIPARWYTDPEIFRAERDCVFGATWVIIGRSEQVAEPRQYLTAHVAGFPVLVVRDEGGELRGFFNVCRHRAAPVLTEESGTATKLRCRYHGWTYDLTGRLRGTPEFEGVCDFSREDHGLIPIEVAIWGPLVAARFRGSGATFEQHLSPMPERIATAISDLTFVKRQVYDLACNWKIYVDNYLDGGYHVNTVHPELAGMLDYSQYRTETFDTTSVQTSPLTTDRSAIRHGFAQYWFVFPNFMLNLYDGLMDTNLVLPLGVNRCRVVFDFYFSHSGPASEEEFQRRSIETAHRIQQEDMTICEEVQSGLASGIFDTGRFSVKREAAGYHFHRLLAAALTCRRTLSGRRFPQKM